MSRVRGGLLFTTSVLLAVIDRLVAYILPGAADNCDRLSSPRKTSSLNDGHQCGLGFFTGELNRSAAGGPNLPFRKSGIKERNGHFKKGSGRNI